MRVRAKGMPQGGYANEGRRQSRGGPQRARAASENCEREGPTNKQRMTVRMSGCNCCVQSCLDLARSCQSQSQVSGERERRERGVAERGSCRSAPCSAPCLRLYFRYFSCSLRASVPNLRPRFCALLVSHRGEPSPPSLSLLPTSSSASTFTLILRPKIPSRTPPAARRRQARSRHRTRPVATSCSHSTSRRFPRSFHLPPRPNTPNTTCTRTRGSAARPCSKLLSRTAARSSSPASVSVPRARAHTFPVTPTPNATPHPTCSAFLTIQQLDLSSPGTHSMALFNANALVG